MKEKILLVEDDKRYAARMAKNLQLEGYEVLTTFSGEEALDVFREEVVDLVLSDIKMPGISGIELIQRLNKMQTGDEHDAPVMFLTSVDSVRVAVDAMKAGAADYITKDSDRDEIVLRIEKVLNSAKVLVQNRNLRKQIQAAGSFGRLVAESPAMKSILFEIDAIADAGAGILIEGETGAGKEIVARYIHNRSPRADQPFIDVNCAAIPTDNLFQSEVFGHEKGAFTGATGRKHGKLELADGGTLLLDEIGDMPLESQGKILRALETQEFERLGGSQKIRVNLAVIAATNKDLRREVQLGNFRQDLLYRLDIIRLRIPPLRERAEDIIPLAQYFFGEYARRYNRPTPEFGAPAVKMLECHPWPGNVRELKNLAERVIIRHRDCRTITEDLLRREGLGEEAPAKEPTPPSMNFEDNLSLEEIEKQAIISALERVGWVQSEAAKLLQISPDRMHTRIKKYGLNHPSWRIHRSNK
ncbi:MAG: sigma-54-dependent Fis family transcriptional regulator [Candidatus Omnitrophica bacterium]|nr:sigma-54-dependent Fis family transcriptional regulator [Candidatus Omnitrophota bacterium]